MAGLVHISEPIRGTRGAPQWRVFLELGFRPLYLGGCLWAAVAIALWIFAPQWVAGTLAGVIWHAHEMLWGFVATIAVGFLLTAGVNWTGAMTVKGAALGVLVACWVGARACFLIPGEVTFIAGSALELVFFFGAAGALGRAIYRTHNRRNYGIPVVVLALGIADALFLWTANGGDYGLLMQRFTAGLLAMAALALLVARRVIPFFAMRAVPGLTLAMHTRSGHWQVAACVLAAIAALGGLHTPGAASVTAVALAVAGGIALVQLVAWKPWAVWRVPLLWVLYAGYAGLGIGLLVGALHAAGIAERAAWPVHVIGIAGFSVLIIGMVTRTALGHLGRPLRADRGMVTSYVLVLAAAVLRFVALVPTTATLAALHASALAWIAAFAIYLWRFAPMLIRPRVDANPLPPATPGRK
ncbi:MAG: NnrS family protein [Burkholderiales bacterium]|nr:NnrS family protein [Burkholderiales bacterium]